MYFAEGHWSETPFDSQRSHAAAFLCLSSPRKSLTEVGILNRQLSQTFNIGGENIWYYEYSYRSCFLELPVWSPTGVPEKKMSK